MSSINQTEQQSAQQLYQQEQTDSTESATAHAQQQSNNHTEVNAQGQVVNTNNTQNVQPTDKVGNVRRATAPNGGAVNTEAPVLPDAEGAKASPKQVAQLPSDALSTYGMAWQALEALSTQANQQENQQARLKRDAEQNKQDAKKQEIKDTQSQIDGQRKSSVYQLMGSLGGAALSFGAGAGGVWLGNTTKMTSMAAGQGLQGSAMMLGQAVNQGTSAWDKLDGGGRQADDAQIAIKFDQMNEDISQQLADTCNSNVQNDQQEWQKAQQTITDMNDRKMQASQQAANAS